MNIPPFTWIEIKEGSPEPLLGEKVLWKFNNGEWRAFVRIAVLDYWHHPSTTHWMKILQPEEMKSPSTEQ